MDIFFNRKFLTKIEDVNGLEKFIKEKNIYKNFKKFNAKKENLIKEEIYKTDKVNYKEIKKFLKKFLPNESNRSLEFWLDRGFEYEESKEIISNLQTNSCRKLNEKNIIRNTNLEYWIKKTGSEESGKELYRNRQSTFSKKKCIEKYGDIIGENIYNERQEKWEKSLNNNKIKHFDHTYKSIKKLKEIFGENSYDLMVEKLHCKEKNKNILKKIIKDCDNINNLMNLLNNEIDIESISDINFIFKSKILQDFFKISEKDFKEKMIIDLNLIVGKVGSMRFFNGTFYHSIGDYKIAKFLTKNNIKFIYNSDYPKQIKSKYKYDFYLEDYNFYVEYFGLIKNDFKKNTKINDNYIEKMDKKILFCLSNHLKLIYDSNLKKLIEKIKNKIYGK